MMGEIREYERSFHAMGTEVRVIVEDNNADEANESLRGVERLFEEFEQRFSRFRSDSELSKLNRDGYLDEPTSEMVSVLRRAIEWAKHTSGVFNPLILASLEAAGYDRSFERYGSFKPRKIRHEPDAISLDDHLQITPDCEGSAVQINGTSGLDLGGIVKGWTVDRASELLLNHDAFLIDAGGDIRTRSSSTHPGWQVSIEDPYSPDNDREIVDASNQAIATSGVYKRRWSDGVSEYHHLIDPCTGSPSASDVIAASVIAPSTETAEVLAKTCVIAGTQAAIPLLDSMPGCSGVLTSNNGQRITSNEWDSYVTFGPLRFQPIRRIA
ncbi:MAG: FAD:protein FMN transferase [Chloroflexi bacterium]|nr:FAD:protein FMN transferase [Chloroflexota bacterium]